MTTSTAQNVYTDSMVSELTALAPVDNDKAISFADKYDLSVHSVRTKAVRMGIYASKPRGVNKNGEKSETKADIVANIATLIGIEGDKLESLEGANVFSLKAIRTALSR